MNEQLRQIGIVDDTFQLFTVGDLIKQKIIEKPLDGNHGEIHPKGDDFVDSGVPFVMASDIKNGQVDYSGCKFITSKQSEELRKGFAKNGDVLVTHKASIGRTAIVDYHQHPFIMLTPQVTYYRTTNAEKLNNRYLKYYFDCELFQKTMKMWAGAGSTRAYIGITAQHKLPVVLPPIQIQNKIAAILSAYDDLIESNKRRIVLLENMAEEIYREWFVRFRFPGYQTTSFEKGIPKGWAIQTIDELVSDIIDYRGITPAKLNGEWQIDGIPAISALNVKNGRLIRMNDTKKVSEALYDKWMRKKLASLDVLLTSEAPLGQVYMLLRDEKYVLSQRVFALRPNRGKISSAYLYHYLLLDLGQHQLQSKATGSTVGGIRQKLLRKVEVIVPTQKLMQTFDNTVLPLMEQGKLLSEQIENLKLTRDGLLPRLISGKLSVEDLNIQFPPSMINEAEAV